MVAMMMRCRFLFFFICFSFGLEVHYLSRDTTEKHRSAVRFDANPSVKNTRLIQLSAEHKAEWMSEEDVERLIERKIHFMDITFHKDDVISTLKPKIASSYPEPRLQEQVTPLFSFISQKRMKSKLTKLTEFFNRHYKSETGLQAAEWLFNELSQIASSSATSITVKKFEHSRWDQFSIIVRIEPELDSYTDTVVVSAHIDSTSGYFGQYNRAPGADDDGSGTTTVLEAFRVLAESNYAPDKPLEFHFYSAEEGGLLGSQDVVSSYSKTQRTIIGALQIDMSGYSGKNKVIGIVNDFTNSQLTTFVHQLVETYTTRDYVSTKCGYACSDHASWTKYGYPSAFAIESAFEDSNPNIHSDKDTVKKIDFEHMEEFVKMSIGFAVELSTADK